MTPPTQSMQFAKGCRVVSQKLLERGVWTTYADGTEKLLPYRIDEVTGEQYVSLDPNGDVFTGGAK